MQNAKCRITVAGLRCNSFQLCSAERRCGRMKYNIEFWNAVDELVNSSEIVIDRPKGTSHPKYPDFIYRVDYGYLKDTSSIWMVQE